MANTDFKILLQTVLNKSGINTELKEVQNIINKYSVDITPEIETAPLRKQMKAVSQEIANDFNRSFGTKLNGDDIFKAYENQAKKVIEKNKTIEKSFTDLRKNTYQSLGTKSSELQQMAAMYRREAMEADKAAISASKINQAIGAGENESKISAITASFRQLGMTTDKIQGELENVNSAFSKLKASPDSNSLIANAKNLEVEYAKVSNQIKLQSANFKGFASESQRLTKADNIVAWMEKNSKASRLFGSDINQMVDKLKLTDNLTVPELHNIEAEFERIQVSAREAGLLGKSFTDSFKDAGSKLTSWLSVTSIIMDGANSFHKMYQSVCDVDTAMTNLYKVTDETDSKYASFLNKSSKSAQELGRSVSSLVEQTANWAKLGYSIDDSADLAKVSSIYANVGEVSDDTAVSDLVTVMKALNIESSKSINIIDELNNLSNNYAVSASGLGEGLKNSASALALQGNSLEQMLALLTGGGEITQEVGELGNMLKVASLRLASMKGKLDEIGETYEDITSVGKNQTQIYNLTKGQVNILDEQNGKLKDTYTILEEVAGAWNDVNDLDKSSLLELMFGKQRANQGAAIISAFQSGQVQKALEDAQNSAGSAMQEQNKWLDSIEAKMGQFDASFQSLSNTIINSDLIKFFIDLGTATTNGTESLFNFLTPLGSIGAGIGLMASKKLSSLGLDFQNTNLTQGLHGSGKSYCYG